MTTTVENITTDTDIAANAWGDTDYWVNETGETIAYLADQWMAL
jgi:hypothetical protein